MHVVILPIIISVLNTTTSMFINTVAAVVNACQQNGLSSDMEVPRTSVP